MSLNFPNPRNVFLPEVPSELKSKPEGKYLQDLKTAIELQMAKSFDNTYSILQAGTSGTFIGSGGGTITVENGVITALS